MLRNYHRGEIYYANLRNGMGSEQKGYRPVIILQNNLGNKNSRTVIVASITSKIKSKPLLPTHYYLDQNCGIKTDSIVLLEQIHTIDKSRLKKHICDITSKDIVGLYLTWCLSMGMFGLINQGININLCTMCADYFFDNNNFILHKTTENSRKCSICGYFHGLSYKLFKCSSKLQIVDNRGKTYES